MKFYLSVFLWNLFTSSLPFSKILNSKSSFRISTQLFLYGEVMESGVQLVFNAVPIAVGIYILQNQDKNLKDALLIQDKNQKDSLNALEKALQIQDKNQKDSLNALEKTLQIQDKNLKDFLQIQDKNLKDILIADKNLWNERFNNFILRLNNTSQ